ncbi:MAG: TIGR03545 family protein [Planctomycetaceae bacterium]
MRWTYLISRLLIVGSVWAFIAFGMDPLLRYSSIQALQTATGARADLGELKTSFFPPSVSVSNVALASARRPGWNLVEFKEMHLGLEPSSLSRRRFVIEEGRLEGLRFDTPRSDDGQLDFDPEPVSEEPSWMSEKLTELGSEWLTNITEQVKSQMDPNTLETYRLGTEVYEKWDERFVEMTDRAKAMKPRVEQLREQFKRAKEGDTLQQIEQYLQVSQKAEEIIIEVQGFRDEIKDIVPEVRDDFQMLNAARERDQEKVKHTLSLLKPDARRISQALLGKTMYRQLQEVLTWIEFARDYQKDLKEQVQPPRSAGRDFEFVMRNPAPDFLLKKLSLTGVVSIKKEQVPFKAMLTDVTEDPKLLGRPCVMRLAAEGSRPLQMKVTYDATGEKTRAEMLVDYRDTNPLPLVAGKPEKASVHATLSDLAWTTRLALIEDAIEGNIDLKSNVTNLSFQASEDMRSEITEAANDAFAGIRVLNASVKLGGTLRDPELDLQSDVGEQVALGVQTAFTNQLDKAKERLISEVNSYASDQIEKLKERFTGEYDKLRDDNKELLAQINEVREIVATLQSGKLDAQTIIRQVKSSKLIPQKDQEKISRVMDEIDNTLQGRSLPLGIQEKLNLPAGAMELPGILQRSNGQFPTTTDVLQQAPIFVPQTSQLLQQTEGFLNRTDSLLNQTDSFLSQPVGILGPAIQPTGAEEANSDTSAVASDETKTSSPTTATQQPAASKTPANRLNIPILPGGLRSLWPKKNAQR